MLRGQVCIDIGQKVSLTSYDVFFSALIINHCTLCNEFRLGEGGE